MVPRLNLIVTWILLKLDAISGFLSASASGVAVVTNNPDLDLFYLIIKASLVAIVSGTLGTLSGWIAKITIIRYIKRKLKIEE
jgi:hypothetical protein